MKGYSLHVGVNKVNKNYYGDELKLNGPINDATYFSGLNNLSNDTCTFCVDDPLTNEMANSILFFKKLNRIISQANENPQDSFVFLSFSGHGASKRFKRQKEALQFLCFHDRMVLEHEITNALRRFAKNVKVLVILDSCYAEGVVVHSHYHKALEVSNNTPKLKSLTNNQTNSIFRHNNNYKKLRKRIKKTKHSHKPYNATICFVSTCSKNESIYDAQSSDQKSEFTQAISNAVDLNEYTNFNDFYHKLTLNNGHIGFGGPVIEGAYDRFFMTKRPFYLTNI